MYLPEDETYLSRLRQEAQAEAKKEIARDLQGKFTKAEIEIIVAGVADGVIQDIKQEIALKSRQQTDLKIDRKNLTLPSLKADDTLYVVIDDEKGEHGVYTRQQEADEHRERLQSEFGSTVKFRVKRSSADSVKTDTQPVIVRPENIIMVPKPTAVPTGSTDGFQTKLLARIQKSTTNGTSFVLAASYNKVWHNALKELAAQGLIVKQGDGFIIK